MKELAEAHTAPVTLPFIHVPTFAVRGRGDALLIDQLFAILYGTSRGGRWCLVRWSPTYRDMSSEHQATCMVR